MSQYISIAGRVVVLAALSVCLAISPARAVSPPPDGDYGLGVTAEGGGALFSLTTGVWDTALGNQTLYNNTTGSSNTAAGVRALFNNIGANNNTAYGVYALYNNTTGTNNIGIGVLAGLYLTTESNCIDIGSRGEAGEANSIRIGTEGTHTTAYMAGIFGVPVTGNPVCVDDEGKLGECTPSAARFKEAIQPMGSDSEAILALKPISFHYKKDLDPNGKPQFGLVAEDVAKVDARLVRYDREGNINGVRYEAVNAMLLNEFLKEHQTVEGLKATVAKQEAIIAQQEKRMEAFVASLKEQQAQIQKVSAQVAVSQPAPQLVNSR